AMLGAVLDASLRLMHPVCPFITEALWPHVQLARTGEIIGLELPGSPLLAKAKWPVADSALGNPDVVRDFDRAYTLVTQVRTLRASQQVKPKQMISMHAPEPVLELVHRASGMVETLSGVGELTEVDAKPAVASPLAFEGSQVFVSGLVDEVDVDAERDRLTKLVEQKTKQIAGFEGKLNNPGYVNNAKPELVAETREMLELAKADLDAATSSLAAL
ncbi:MAG: hypothetical protein EX269_16580, partial [Acidimicrobiales bacterium]